MLPRTTAPLYYDLVVSACQRAGFSPHFTHEAGAWQTALALVAAGLGVMIVPESLRHWQRPGVTYLEFKPKSGSLALELIWRSRGPQPLVEAFVATARRRGGQGRGERAARRLRHTDYVIASRSVINLTRLRGCFLGGRLACFSFR